MTEQEVTRKVREIQFTRAIDILETGYSRPLIKSVVHVGENAYGVVLNYFSWSALAKKLAQHLPGIVMPTTHGIIWICGGNGPHGTLIDNTPIDPLDPLDPKRTRLDAVIEARNAVKKTGYKGEPSWTTGGNAKKLLKYISPPDAYSAYSETLFNSVKQGYFRCLPGEYEVGTLYDVSAYYYSLLARLDEKKRSLRVLVGNNSATFYPWREGERERFQEVLKAVAKVKSLRNALVGSGQGSLEPSVAYTSSGSPDGRARFIQVPGSPGPFRNVSLLIVRTGYELTQKEALTNNAVYSMIDSVVLPPSQEPTVWKQFGLEARPVHSGITDVVARNNYKVGPEEKELYKAGDRTREAEAGEVILPVLYYQKWL